MKWMVYYTNYYCVIIINVHGYESFQIIKSQSLGHAWILYSNNIMELSTRPNVTSLAICSRASGIISLQRTTLDERPTLYAGKMG